MRHEAEKVIPDREALAQVTLLNTGPDGVDDDDIIHHDDDPGQAAEDEDDGDHDEDQGQSLLAFTEVTDMSLHVNNIRHKLRSTQLLGMMGDKYFLEDENMFCLRHICS